MQDVVKLKGPSQSSSKHWIISHLPGIISEIRYLTTLADLFQEKISKCSVRYTGLLLLSDANQHIHCGCDN